jgi:hypothetical protein
MTLEKVIVKGNPKDLINNITKNKKKEINIKVDKNILDHSECILQMEKLYNKIQIMEKDYNKLLKTNEELLSRLQSYEIAQHCQCCNCIDKL